ncbi:MAG: YceI family protein [Flavobacteriales bacterium]|nr:YceI family protein [Flavobacteriales bacterium]
MNKNIIAAAIAAPLLAFTVANSEWKLDNAHAKLRFSITHLGINDVEGSFRTIDATISAPNANDLTGATITFTADARSIDTDNKMRDEHLQGADFFDAAKHPAISYRSTSVTKVSGDRYKVQGNLTVKGVTKPVELTATARYGVHPMNQKSVAGVKVTGTIDRTQFGIGSGMGGATLSDNVEITGNAEFVQQ